MSTFPVNLDDLYDPTFSDGLSPSKHLDRLYGRVSPPLPTEEVAQLLDWIHREAVHGPCADEWRLAAKLLQQLSAGASEQLGAIAGTAETPTDEDLEASFRDWWKDRHGSAGLDAVPLAPFIIEWTKFALARYGCTALEPIPVSARPWANPGRDWCNQNGECWWCPADGPAYWSLAEPAMVYGGWLLPHWALPLPPNHSPDATKMAGEAQP
jgi:hypothetical protein